MPHTRINWMNYSPPAINAANLLNMENGIWYGLAHSGGVRNTAEFLDRNPASTTGGLDEAIADLGGSPGIVFAAPHNHPINVNNTIPANVQLIAGRGATFTIANGVTLTLNQTPEAGDYRIFAFTGTGTVVLTQGIAKAYWFGISTSESAANNRIYLDKLIDAVGANAAKIELDWVGIVQYNGPWELKEAKLGGDARDVIIEGRGRTCFLKNVAAGQNAVEYDANRLVFRDFFLRGDGTNYNHAGAADATTGDGFMGDDTAKMCKFDNVVSGYHGGSGWHVIHSWINGWQFCLAEANTLHGWFFDAIATDDAPTQNALYRCQSKFNYGDGYRLEAILGDILLHEFSSCTAGDWNGGHGFYGRNDAETVYINCNAETNDVDALHLYNSFRPTIIGGGFHASGRYGVYMENVYSPNFIGPRAIGNTTKDLFVHVNVGQAPYVFQGFSYATSTINAPIGTIRTISTATRHRFIQATEWSIVTGAPALTAYGASPDRFWGWAFDAGSDEAVQAWITLPEDWVAGSDVALKAYIAPSDASGPANVRIYMEGAPIAVGEVLTLNAASTDSKLQALPGVAYELVTRGFSGMAGAGFTAGDVIRLYFMRDGNAGDDLYGADMIFIGADLLYQADI